MSRDQNYISNPLALDLTPLTLAVESFGGISIPIISKGTPIPVTVSKIFTTVFDDQNSFTLNILQGERLMATDNYSLGILKISDIPLAPRGSAKIEVTFNIDENGLLFIKTKDKQTDIEIKTTFLKSDGLSLDDQEKMLKNALQHADDDFLKRKSLMQTAIIL